MSTVEHMKPGESLWIKADSVGLELTPGRCKVSLEAETFRTSQDPLDVVVYRSSEQMRNLDPKAPKWICVGLDLDNLFTLDLTDAGVVEATITLLQPDFSGLIPDEEAA